MAARTVHSGSFSLPEILPSLRLHDTDSLTVSCLRLMASAQSLAVLRQDGIGYMRDCFPA